MTEQKIDGRSPSSSYVMVIAEIGSVHDGSLGNALCLIDAAAAAGADAVKFQTHIAEAETLRDAPMPPYFRGEPRYEYFQRTGFALDAWRTLKGRCDSAGQEFMSSPFSEAAVELLETVGVNRYKIGSGEMTNLPLLDMVGQTGKPVILSSGMSTWFELDGAVNTILKHHRELVLLQCTSEYPCPYDQVGLNVMLKMKERYGLPVGLSDHTLTAFAPLVAVALGASVIEKHFTFSRLMYGSDARHSLEPEEFRQMVNGIRAAEAMVSVPVDKDATAHRLKEMKAIFEKSIVTAVDVPSGVILTREMLTVKKPGTGISAARLHDYVGRRTRRDIPINTLLSEDALHA